jgi:coproporphyrinogen III oxidase
VFLCLIFFDFTLSHVVDGRSGESIPIRLFLGGFDLTPTYRNIHSKFSVKYYLNLVLVDEDDRRYYKQQEYVYFYPSHFQ